MQTGRPLYIVGTSTFGRRPGYLMPGLLMCLLQLGWFAVATYVSTNFIMKGLHQTSGILFTVVALLWAYGLAFVAIKGISYVARAAQFMDWVPLVMIIIIVFIATIGGLPNCNPPEHHPGRGFAKVLEIVIGYIAWALGFIARILDHIPGVPAGWVAADHPAPLYAFVVGSVVYWALAKAGLRPPVIPEYQLTPPMQTAVRVP